MEGWIEMTYPTAEDLAGTIKAIEVARLNEIDAVAKVDAAYERMLKTLIQEGRVAREAIAQLEVANDSLREQIKQLRAEDL